MVRIICAREMALNRLASSLCPNFGSCFPRYFFNAVMEGSYWFSSESALKITRDAPFESRRMPPGWE